MRAHRRQERELLKQGRKGKAWFLKKGVVRERASALSGNDSGETAVDGLKKAGIGVGKTDKADTYRKRDGVSLQNKKREVRREKKLMGKEKAIMGQRRRT